MQHLHADPTWLTPMATQVRLNIGFPGLAESRVKGSDILRCGQCFHQQRQVLRGGVAAGESLGGPGGGQHVVGLRRNGSIGSSIEVAPLVAASIPA